MPETTAGLIDLTGVSLAEVLKLTGNPVLAASIRRVTEPVQPGTDSVSAFQSALGKSVAAFNSAI